MRVGNKNSESTRHAGKSNCRRSVDGFKGFPEAIATVFPQTQVQPCIVHQVRGSLHLVSWKQRKEVAADWRYRGPGFSGH